MDDTIYRQSAIDVVHSAVIDFFDCVEDDSESPITYHDEQLLSLNKAITTKIKALPSVERKKGKWEVTSVYIKCSECGESFMLIPQNYCPNCGADMRGDTDEQTKN